MKILLGWLQNYCIKKGINFILSKMISQNNTRLWLYLWTHGVTVDWQGGSKKIIRLKFYFLKGVSFHFIIAPDQMKIAHIYRSGVFSNLERLSNRGNVTNSADKHTSLLMTDSHLIQILSRFDIGFPQILTIFKLNSIFRTNIFKELQI